MSSPKVFIFAPADPTGATHRQLEDAGCTLVLGEASWQTPKGDNEAAVCALAEGVAAMAGTSIRSSPISRRVLEASPDLRIVAKYTIGVDEIDIEAANALGILVTHGPTEANWGGVAEGTMAIMLALLKKLRERDARVKRGEWRDATLAGTYLGARQDGYQGITIGIVGLGRIGSRLAQLLAPWRVRLLACDPYVEPAKFALHNAQRVDLATLLAQSDVVTLHVNLTAETRGLIGAAELALMKPEAILISAARGAVVDQDALYDALAGERIAAAGLDVFAEEPVAPQSPILDLGDRVLLSPHMIASNRDSGLGPGIKWATRSILTALRGEVPDNVYNREVIERWRERFAGNSLL